MKDLSAPVYVVLWIECDDNDDAEQIEDRAVQALAPVARHRLIQNRIQESPNV